MSPRPPRRRCWWRSRAPKARFSIRPKASVISTSWPGFRWQCRSRQSGRGARRAGAGCALHACDGLRRAGRDAAGGVCRQDRVAAARAARKRLFRQLGRRGGRGGFETGETFYPAYGDRLHAPRLPRVDARRDEHDGCAREGRGVEERGVPAPAARRAGRGVQRFLRTGAHYAPHGLCAGRAGAGRGRRPSARVRVIWMRCADAATKSARC